MEEQTKTNPESYPKVLLCGAHRSGKTSILKVVFEKMSPHETLFLEPTTRVVETEISRNTLVGFKALDYPASSHVDDGSIDPINFKNNCAVVFVIDAQEEPYDDALSNAKRIIEQAYKINPKVTFDILIHKADGDQFFSDEHKTEIQRDIDTKLTEELAVVDAQITFHCTSIYDHTIFEALSKVVQKLIPYVNWLEQALDMLISNSRMEKAFLFDVVSKIYLASDTQPVDLQSYELCSDMIDVVIDVSCIYGVADGCTSSKDELSSDAKSSCAIHLMNGTMLYLREVDKCLALVCIIREENYDRQHLLERNIQVFKKALGEIFVASQMSSVAGGASSSS